MIEIQSIATITVLPERKNEKNQNATLKGKVLEVVHRGRQDEESDRERIPGAGERQQLQSWLLH